MSGFKKGFEKVALRIDTYVRALNGRYNRTKAALSKYSPQQIESSLQLKRAQKAVSKDVPKEQVKKLVWLGMSPDSATRTPGWRTNSTKKQKSGKSQFNRLTRIHNIDDARVPSHWKAILKRGSDK